MDVGLLRIKVQDVFQVVSTPKMLDLSGLGIITSVMSTLNMARIMCNCSILWVPQILSMRTFP
jgi:hypothetical protein